MNKNDKQDALYAGYVVVRAAANAGAARQGGSTSEKSSGAASQSQAVPSELASLQTVAVMVPNGRYHTYPAMTSEGSVHCKVGDQLVKLSDVQSLFSHSAATGKAAPAVLDLPSAIMNIRWGKEFSNFEGHPNTRLAYKVGHRDARHAAADLVLERADELAALASPAAPLAGKPDKEAMIEAAAKAIYQRFPGAEAHPWVERGNSTKQDDARYYARAAFSAFTPLAAAVPAGEASEQAVKVKCPECKGTGQSLGPFACSDCNGKGYDWDTPAEPAPIQASALTDEQLRETDGYKLGWMEGMQEGAELATGGEKTAADVEAEFADLLPGSYYMDLPDGGSPTVLEQVSRMAEDAAQWRAHLARLSKPTAQGTAFDDLVNSLTDFLRREMPAGTVISRSDWWAMKIARHIAAQATAGRDAVKWGRDLQQRLMAASQNVAEDDEARQVMAEAACLLAELTGHPSQPAASHGAEKGEQK